MWSDPDANNHQASKSRTPPRSEEYGTAYIQVSGHGTVISGSYSGTYSVTIPAHTDLSTFSVTGYAKASSINGDEAEVDLGTMTIN